MKFPAFLQTLLTDYFRWVAVALSVLVLILGYLFVLDQKIANVRQSGVLERANVEAELESQQAYLDKLQASISSFEALVPADALDQVNAFVPTGGDFPGLVMTLEALAIASNLTLDSVAVNEVGQTVASTGQTTDSQAAAGTPALAATAAGLNLRTQDVTVTVSGGTSYDSFKRFLTLVESSQRLLDVVSVGFAFPSPTTPEATVAPYAVVVRTYYLPES